MQIKYSIEAWGEGEKHFKMEISIPNRIGDSYDPFPVAEWLREKVGMSVVSVVETMPAPDGSEIANILHEYINGEWSSGTGELIVLQ